MDTDEQLSWVTAPAVWARTWSLALYFIHALLFDISGLKYMIQNDQKCLSTSLSLLSAPRMLFQLGVLWRGQWAALRRRRMFRMQGILPANCKTLVLFFVMCPQAHLLLTGTRRKKLHLSVWSEVSNRQGWVASVWFIYCLTTHSFLSEIFCLLN